MTSPDEGVTVHQTCPAVREVQGDILSHLKAAAARVGAPLIYADLVLSPRPVVWFCGDFDQIEAFQEALKDDGYNLARIEREKLTPFHPVADQSASALAYRLYKSDDIVIHGATSGVEIEFCLRDDDGIWRARRAGLESDAPQDYLDALDDFEFAGVTLPVLRNCAAVWDTHPAKAKIDLVYTWVDGTDPAWLARKAHVRHEEAICGANAAARFESGTELMYSVISALRYFADLGHIYIVTDKQVPQMLGEDLLGRVTIVDHTEIFGDEGSLPTFNSHAIGAMLYNIPGLRKHYIYLNDDVLFGRPVAASTFFDEFGRSYQFHSTVVSTPHVKIGALESAVDAAARNNRQLLHEKFGVFPFRKFKHTPVPVDREVMEDMRRDLPEAWERTICNQFRSPEDHAIAGHLYAHYAAYRGRSVTGTIRYAYYNLAQPEFPDRFRVSRMRDWIGTDVFCINETDITPDTALNREHMDTHLAEAFPRGGVVSSGDLLRRGGGRGPAWRRMLRDALPDPVLALIRKVRGRASA